MLGLDIIWPCLLTIPPRFEHLPDGIDASQGGRCLQTMNHFADRRMKCSRYSLALGLGLGLIVRAAVAAEQPTGEMVYRAKCASCHGSKGEGKTENYPHPLVGDRSIGELTEYVGRTMPEDKPGTCIGDEARLVSQFIHEQFYSPTAQARNKPARVDLSRLTVRQYRNAVAELVGHFRGAGKSDERQGLVGEYFKSRNLRGNDRVFERVDPVVAFDFQDKGPDIGKPDAEKMEPHEFAIQWHGSIFAQDTGEYEFLVRTDQATRLWINDLKHPLVDAYVKSGTDTEHRGSIVLLGGRTYALQLEFSKASQGVQDEKAKEKPSAKASISLEWKRPHRVNEVIPARSLSAGQPSEICVVTSPFPPDDRSLGWERATSISKEWDQATTDAAIEVAAYFVSHLQELSGVNRDSSDRTAKLKEFCGRLAERAFRRPLDDELRRLYIDRPFEKAGDPEIAVNRVVLLVLKSPRFLYRELGAVHASLNDPYDVASRISFGLWDSSPDQTLLQAAAKGELSTREQVVDQARRMTSDPRFQSKLREFLLRWLKIDRVPDLTKDPDRYPEFNEIVANDLRTSLELFLDDLLASESSDFRQLLLSDSLYLNGRLAKFYGADLSDDAPFQKVSLESNVRAGVLSHPYLMTGFAYTGTSSPIHRGIFIARSVLGRTLRPPPEAVTPLAPQLQPDLTTRDRVALQTRPEACQSCHSMINPLGFTLEHFDAVGRFRKEENGKPIVATGVYRTRQGDTVQFDGVRDLAKFLADSPETHAAFVEQLFHAMIKQPIRAYGSQTKESLRETFVRENFSIRRLMVEIIATSALTTADLKPQSIGATTTKP